MPWPDVVFKSDGESFFFFNDGLQSFGEPKILAPPSAYGSYLMYFWPLLRSREMYGSEFV